MGIADAFEHDFYPTAARYNQVYAPRVRPVTERIAAGNTVATPEGQSENEDEMADDNDNANGVSNTNVAMPDAKE